MIRSLLSPGFVFGVFVLLVLGGGAALAPWLAPYDWNETMVGPRLGAPSDEYLMGLDLFGRDLFSRVLYGGRLGLAVGLATVAIAVVFGASLGAAMGFYGGRLDRFAGRIVDVMLGFPPLVAAILAGAAAFPVNRWLIARGRGHALVHGDHCH